MKSTSSTASTSTVRGAVADQDHAVAYPADEPSCAFDAGGSCEPDAVVALKLSRGALERLQRVQHDVLVHEHEAIVASPRCPEVEGRTRGMDRSVAVVDKDVIEIVDLEAMALDGAIKALLAHRHVVEDADDRDGTSRGPHIMRNV